MHAAGGLGYGVDRMQRLAHTDWVDKDIGKQQRAVVVPDNFDKPDPTQTIFLKTNDTDDKSVSLKNLNVALQGGGLLQWRPDGMVLSKLESPAGDTISSQQLDARQAQLFNIAVQGPALAKSWTGDSKLASMPMDRVFMALVAKKNGNTLSKFRVMRTTSSHLVAYSTAKEKPCGLEDKEVIVGAWCIGTALDSAASRSTVGSLVRTAPASMALNVNVQIDWWSADRMWRCFMNKAATNGGVTTGSFAPRYGATVPDASIDDINKKHEVASAAAAAPAPEISIGA